MKRVERGRTFGTKGHRDIGTRCVDADDDDDDDDDGNVKCQHQCCRCLFFLLL